MPGILSTTGSCDRGAYDRVSPESVADYPPEYLVSFKESFRSKIPDFDEILRDVLQTHTACAEISAEILFPLISALYLADSSEPSARRRKPASDTDVSENAAVSVTFLKVMPSALVWVNSGAAVGIAFSAHPDMTMAAAASIAPVILFIMAKLLKIAVKTMFGKNKNHL